MQTACSKSWTDVNIDFKNRKLGHCCKSVYYDIPDEYSPDFIDNSKLIQERRQHTLKGIQHPDCAECWRDIANGHKPYKDWKNEWDNFNNVSYKESQVNYIEIELDSTCDLSCLYCYAEVSSKIAQEEGVKIQDKTRDYDVENVKVWLHKIVEASDKEITLSFSGGEPTSSKFFYQLMEFINTLDTSKIRLDVITNGNSKPFLFQKFISEIDKFKGIMNISISNETYKEDSQLIRYGLNWDRFESNVRAYAAHNNVQHINLSINVPNIGLPTFSEYLIWAYNTLSEYNVSFAMCGAMINFPEELDVAILPSYCKRYVKPAIEFFSKLEYNKDFCDKEEFLLYLTSLEDRIGSNYQNNYKEIIGDYLAEKERVKNTNTLMKLTNI